MATAPSSEPGTAHHSPAPSSAASIGTTESAPTSDAALEQKLAEKAGSDDASKLKTFLNILRRFIGVSDLAAIRFSLPAQLMEPIPNLGAYRKSSVEFVRTCVDRLPEYWNYIDRPDAFISIGDSDDELGRMFEVLRFWLTKDLVRHVAHDMNTRLMEQKYVKGKPCKPYNSALGEFFRCTWEVADTYQPVVGKGNKTSLDGSDTLDKPLKVHYLTEQTCHHPPVSAYVVQCPQKGLIARGYDQISAKFTGTSIKVGPGQHNEGIYIQLQRRDNEEYHLTHPIAALGGLLRGALSVTVSDMCYVTCEKTKIRALLHYVEEGWLGRTQNKLNGIIYRFDSETDKLTRLKDVPPKSILAKVEGNWHEKIFYTIGDEEEKKVLIDIQSLEIATKICPPESEQLPNESRRYWQAVTDAIHAKQFGVATRTKQELEEKQRQKVIERQKDGTEFHPRFFKDALEPKAKPELSDDGRLALEGMETGAYRLEEKAP